MHLLLSIALYSH